MRLVSVLIPLYNEEEVVGALLERVLSASLPSEVCLEIVVVDDGSTDGSAVAAAAIAEKSEGRVRVVRHGHNQGKGAAVRTAIAQARGEFAIIQEADLEYDPNEYATLLGPLLAGRADAVFESRSFPCGERRVLGSLYALANRALTTLCKVFADVNLTRIESGYKAFRLSLVKSIPLRSKRFGIEAELTIKLAQRGACIYDSQVGDHGRACKADRKIGVRAALQTLFTIVRFSVTRDTYLDGGARILDALAHTPRFNEWMASFVSPYLGERVLEIGAGIGNLTMQLSRQKRSYTATDYDTEHLARLRTRLLHRTNIDVAKCDLQNADDFRILDGNFDSVVCLNVLEHVKDDLQALRNLKSILRPGGTAVILVPHDPGIFGTLDTVLGHERRYAKDQLRSKMKEAGFEVAEMIDFNRITRPGWILNARLLKRKSFGRWQLWIFDRLVWFAKKVDHRLPWPAISIIAIGIKH